MSTSNQFTTLDLSADSNDSKTVSFVVTQPDQNGVQVPRDITGWTLESIIKTKAGATASANFQITVTDPTKGIVRAFLPSDHGLAIGEYNYEIDMSMDDQRETLLRGKLTITPSVFAQQEQPVTTADATDEKIDARIARWWNQVVIPWTKLREASIPEPAKSFQQYDQIQGRPNLLTTSDVDARINPAARQGGTARMEKSNLPSDAVYENDLADVAVSGEYTDLSNPPILLTTNDVDQRIDEPARARSGARWPKEKLPADSVFDGDLSDVATSGSYNDLGNRPTIPGDSEIDLRIKEPARAQNTTAKFDKNVLPTDVVYTESQRFTRALASKLNALPNASDLRFDNHPIGTSAAFNALSTTTAALDFVTITASISSGIQNAYDAQGNALTSLENGDLLILDHSLNRWERIGNLIATGGGGISLAQARDLILAQARTGNTDRWGKGKVPSDTVYDGDLADVATSGSYNDLSGRPSIPTNTSIDSRILPTARTGSTARWQKSKVPSDTVYDGDLSAVATSGSYNDLSNRPTIPGNTEIDNRILAQARSGNTTRWGKGKVPSDTVYDGDLADVATSGSYTDLSGTPNLATVATSGSYTDLSGTPNLATVATSGSYNDLSNRPTIPTNTTIDNRILETARAGNTGRWAKNKLPTDVFYDADLNDDAILDLAKTTRVTGDRGKFLGVSTTNQDELALLDAPSGGSSSFTGLSDTPSSFTGQGGKVVQVNSGATALIFADAASGGGGGGFVETQEQTARIDVRSNSYNFGGQQTYGNWVDILTFPAITQTRSGGTALIWVDWARFQQSGSGIGRGTTGICQVAVTRIRGAVTTDLGTFNLSPRSSTWYYLQTGTSDRFPLFPIRVPKVSSDLMTGDVFKVRARSRVNSNFNLFPYTCRIQDMSALMVGIG